MDLFVLEVEKTCRNSYSYYLSLTLSESTPRDKDLDSVLGGAPRKWEGGGGENATRRSQQQPTEGGIINATTVSGNDSTGPPKKASWNAS